MRMSKNFVSSLIGGLSLGFILVCAPAWSEENTDTQQPATDAEQPVTKHTEPEQVETKGLWTGEADAPTQSIPMTLGTDEDEFTAMDQDKDGRISQKEGTQERVMMYHWKVVDKNADTTIDKNEYKTYYRQRYGGYRPYSLLGEEERKAHFHELDKDGNGELSSTEFYDSIL